MVPGDVASRLEVSDGLQEAVAALSRAHGPGSTTPLSVLAAPPGCGRTTVLRRVAERLSGTRGAVALLSCTESTGDVPLSVFAPFLDDGADTPDRPLALLHRLHGTLGGQRSDRTTLLVDDAQHLDGPSCILLHQLLHRGAASVVLAVDSTASAPDDLSTITSSHPTEWVELGVLDRSGSDGLVELFHDGTRSSQLLEQIWQLAGGVPAYTIELACGPVVDGRPRPTAPLVAAVRRRLARCGVDAQLFAALSVHHRIPEDACVDTFGSDALRSAERAGLASRRRVGALTFVEPTFALVTHVAGLGLSAHERREVARRLVDVMPPSDVGSGSSDLLIARAELLHAAQLEDPAAFEAAAEAALRRHDAESALRHARAAEHAGAGLSARLTAATAHALAGEFEVAERAFDELVDADDPDLAARAARRWSLAALFDRADPQESERVLDLAVERGLPDGEALRRSQLPNLRFYSGSALDAFDAFEDLGTEAAVLPFDALPGGLSAAVALGRPDRCLELLEREETWNWDHTMTAISLIWVRLLALWQVGRLGEVATPTDGLVDVETETLMDSILLGRVMPASLSLLRGLLPAAAPIDQDQDALRANAPPQVAAFVFALAAQRQALLGRSDRSRDIVRRADELPKMATTGFSWWIARSEAIALAAEGRRSEAASAALHLADDHADGRFYRTTSLYDAATFGAGRAVVDALSRLAAADDATWWVRACATYVEALVAGDVEGLVGASDRFERGGLLLCALQASDDAARLGSGPARGPKDRLTAERSRSRARRLREQCGPVATLAPNDELSGLTEREYTVAALAARGLTNSAIAAQLGTSVRTVGNQLQRAYQKLGLHSRSELSGLLPGATAHRDHRTP